MLWWFIIFMVGGLVVLLMSKRRLEVSKSDLMPERDDEPPAGEP